MSHPNRKPRNPARFLLLTLLLLPAAGGAADYYVDPATGSDTTGNGTQGTPWQSLTFALQSVTGPGAVIHAAAGTYARPNESFPIAMKPGVSLVGAGAGLSVLRDDRDAFPERATVIFCSRSGALCTLTGKPGGNFTPGDRFEGFTVERISSKPGGIGIWVNSQDASSSPTITRNTVRNYRVGIESLATSYNAATTASATVTANRVEGVAYTAAGNPEERKYITAGLVSYAYMGPPDRAVTESSTFTNNLVVGRGSGAFTGSTAAYPPPSASKLASLRGQATLTNNTIVGGSSDGLYVAAIDTSGLPSAAGLGYVSPSLANNLLSENSGWGIREGANHSDPALVQANDLDRNAAGLYRKDGAASLALAEINSQLPGGGNLDAQALFVDPVSNDYHLASGAPQADSGAQPSSAPADDLDGQSRPQEGDGAGGPAWDIGADEYFPCVAVASTAGSETTSGCNGPATLDSRQSTVDPVCAAGLVVGWYRGTTLLSNAPLYNVSPGTPTAYTLRVRCADPALSACSDSAQITVTPASAPLASAGPDQAIPLGQQGTLGGSPTAAGGTPGYSYQWSPAAPGLSSATDPNPVFAPQSAGSTVFSVEVTDAAGCVASDSVTITVPAPPPLIPEAGGPFTVPLGQGVVLGGAPSGSGGVPPLYFSWLPSTGLDATDSPNPTFTPASTGVYEFTLTVTDGYGGLGTDTASVTVTAPGGLFANAGPDRTVIRREPTVLGGGPAGGGGAAPLSYAWTPALPGLSDPSAPNPSFQTDVRGVYDFTLTVTDASSQEATDTVRVTVEDFPALLANAGPDRSIPTGIPATLGGDAVNPTASGGVPVYSYQWDPSTGLDSAISPQPVFQTMVPGVYAFDLTVRDSVGQTALDRVTITVADPGGPPGEATALRVRNGCRAQGTLAVAFSPAPGADRHRLYRGALVRPFAWGHSNPAAPEGCDANDPAADPDLPGEFHAASSCGPGSQYFLVAGVNGFGEGTLGRDDTDADPATPGTPREDLYTAPAAACP